MENIINFEEHKNRMRRPLRTDEFIPKVEVILMMDRDHEKYQETYKNIVAAMHWG